MDVCHAAFLSLINDTAETGNLPQMWVMMQTLFPDSLVKNTRDLFSKETITHYIGKESRREIWTVSSNASGLNYVMATPMCFHCSCKSFVFSVLKDGKLPFCKHVLAVFICNAFYQHQSNPNLYKDVEMDDVQLAKFLERSFVNDSQEE